MKRFDFKELKELNLSNNNISDIKCIELFKFEILNIKYIEFRPK